VKRNYINSVLVIATIGSILLACTDASGAVKNAQWLADDIIKCVVAVGVQYVAVVCMDGAKACISAMNLVHLRFPSVFPQRCATHGAQLIFKGIANVFADVLKGVVVITAWVVNHDFVHDIFKSMGARALLQPAGTRMVGEFIAADALLKDQSHIEELVAKSRFPGPPSPPLWVCFLLRMLSLFHVMI
jgi:hypothetical protein